MEETLADLLKIEVKTLKRKSAILLKNDEIKNVNRTIKYILYYLTIQCH